MTCTAMTLWALGGLALVLAFSAGILWLTLYCSKKLEGTNG